MRYAQFKFSKLPLLFAAAALLSACEAEDDGGLVTPSSITLQSSQTTATIVRGGTITVPLTVSRSNYSGAVNLTAENLPIGCHGDIQPGVARRDGHRVDQQHGHDHGVQYRDDGHVEHHVPCNGRQCGERHVDHLAHGERACRHRAGERYHDCIGRAGQRRVDSYRDHANGRLHWRRESRRGRIADGVTATFAPATIASGARVTTLTLNAANNAAAGPSTITIRASGAGITEQTQTLNFTVNPSTTSGFGASASPAAILVTAGQSASTTLTISRQSSFAGNVQFVLEGAPTGVTASIAPNPVTAGTANVNISTTAATAPGVYQLTLRGTSAGVTERTVGITLIVTAP